MKSLSIFLITLVFAMTIKGQERKDLVIAVSSGLLNSPFYEKASARGFFKIHFDYHLTSRHILTANYLAGQHYYYDDVLSNDPISIGYPNRTNSTAEYRTTSVMYKYRLFDNQLFSIVPGAGAGVLTHTREYPYQEERKSYNRISSWSDLVFPVSLDINYKLSSRWQFGLTGGFLIHPDYPILALHAGPRLSIVLP